MLVPPRRYASFVLLVLCLIYALYILQDLHQASRVDFGPAPQQKINSSWAELPQRYPVSSSQQLPQGKPIAIPKIQHSFRPEAAEARSVRELRLQAVKRSFIHAWNGYKRHAWLKDEVAPLSGEPRNSFGGWAATLVDSLDTLWIMGLYDEFDEAIDAISGIDFQSSSSKIISVFETTIRYLGGLLSAYDLSKKPLLLGKAIELGEMLYMAFDTPSRMPVPYWDWKNAKEGGPQDTLSRAVSADLGSLTLELTRLSQLSGDPKFFDAIQRITDLFQEQQNRSALPGMWPVFIEAQNTNFASGNEFSLGAMADSLYEYLPKQFLLLGGLRQQYRYMYQTFIESAIRSIFFHVMNSENKDILFSGVARLSDRGISVDSSGQHLTCFVAGMVGIGAKIFEREADLYIARQLVDGCIWAYESMPSGIMPEIMNVVPCPSSGNCQWNEAIWHQAVVARGGSAGATASDVIEKKGLPAGFTDVGDGRYLVRPEAIESVFIMYRITGDIKLQEQAWKMFQAIEKHTRTDIAHAALENVVKANPTRMDKMESFWTAETLKYFYLIFSKPDLISLDDYVFNTEAHPFRRPGTEKREWWP